MKTARGAIFRQPKKPLDLSELALPQCGAREALVQVSLATICASDLHTFEGRRNEPCPSILGHEGVGRVMALGEGRDRNLVGQRVTWTIADSCGKCVPCHDWELPQKCSHLFKYGHATTSDGCGLNGCYATHILLRAGTTIIPVPDSLSDELVAPANCALATMVGATEWLPKPCNVAVIQGAGMLGLYGCALLRCKGVERVVVVDTDPARLELVKHFGGEPTLSTQTISQGSVDAVFEVAGTSAIIPEGVRLLRTGGYYAFIGMVHPGTPLELSGQTVVRQCLTFRGFHNYAPRHLEYSIQFLNEQRTSFPWEKLVSPAYPLGEINAAFDEAGTRKWARVSVKP